MGLLINPSLCMQYGTLIPREKCISNPKWCSQSVYVCMCVGGGGFQGDWINWIHGLHVCKTTVGFLLNLPRLIPDHTLKEEKVQQTSSHSLVLLIQ